ncbi:MAG: DUF1259 domain-containing protein [Actinobacteria bacterium]|nr:DUF1259 domain-containing protein [Actinomycetota bacterium]
MHALIRTLVLVSMVLLGCSSAGPEQQGAPTPGAAPRGDAAATGDANDWQAVGDALGIPGKVQDGGVYRISMPRSDLNVTVGEVAIRPSFALGSYAAFLGSPDDALVVGDLVLLEDEANPVLARLQDAGLAQTALHRHLLGEEPEVMYMHYSGRGDAVELARGIRHALGASATPLEPGPAPDPTPFSFDTTELDDIIGYQGQDKGGVWGYGIGRAEPVTMDGVELPPSSGVATALNFQDLGEGRAAINGDFAMTPDEVDGVLRALRDADIAVEATHQHMLDDEPRLIYSHFWATGDAADLADGLRAALDHVDSAEPLVS